MGKPAPVRIRPASTAHPGLSQDTEGSSRPAQPLRQRGGRTNPAAQAPWADRGQPLLPRWPPWGLAPAPPRVLCFLSPGSESDVTRPGSRAAFLPDSVRPPSSTRRSSRRAGRWASRRSAPPPKALETDVAPPGCGVKGEPGLSFQKQGREPRKQLLWRFLRRLRLAFSPSLGDGGNLRYLGHPTGGCLSERETRVA